MLKSVLFFCLLAVATADYDQALCDDNMKAKVVSGAPTVKFPKSFNMVLERTDITSKVVLNKNIFYSQYAGAFSSTSRAGDNITRKWVNGQYKYDREIATTWRDESTDCIFSEVKNANMASDITLIIPKGNDFDIAPSQDIFRYGPNKKSVYIGQGLKRGMLVDKFEVCLYDDATDITSYAEFSFAASTVTMPYYNSIPIQAEVLISKKGKKPHTVYYDYVNVEPVTYNFVNKLYPPANTYCQGENHHYASMPIMPETFSFKASTTVLKDPGSYEPQASLEYVKEEFMKEHNLYFIEKKIQNTDSGSDYAEITREIHDYTLGVSFFIDVLTEECAVGKITKGSDVADGPPGSKPTRKKSQEFFLLDKNYIRTGILRRAIRGIDCYVYVSHELKDDGSVSKEFTYYFATRDWMTYLGQYAKYSPLPIAVSVNDVDKNEFKVQHYYEFSHEPLDVHPDYSMCFDHDNTLHMYITLKGGTYSNVYKGHITVFTDSFVAALKKFGGFTSSLRINPTWTSPQGRDQIIVYFLLFGLPKKGLDLDEDTYPSIDTIYNKLKNAINGGTFSYTMNDKDGKPFAQLTGFHIGNSREDIQNAIKDKGKFNGNDNGNDDGAYSGGDMAGIAIGLLIMGLLVGFLVMFAYQKKFGAPADRSGFSMKTLEEESAS